MDTYEKLRGHPRDFLVKYRLYPLEEMPESDLAAAFRWASRQREERH